jgi:hypothetical protein
MKTRALGTTQAAFLRAMLEHGGFWHEKCGWNWESPRITMRLCETLERRGLLMPGLLRREDRYYEHWVIKDKTKVERALKAVTPLEGDRAKK